MDIIDCRYAELAGAVVRMAMSDYKAALKSKSTKPKRIAKIRELERFFLSDYGQALSLGRGQELIDLCRKEVAAEKKNEKQPKERNEK